MYEYNHPTRWYVWTVLTSGCVNGLAKSRLGECVGLCVCVGVCVGVCVWGVVCVVCVCVGVCCVVCMCVCGCVLCMCVGVWVYAYACKGKSIMYPSQSVSESGL